MEATRCSERMISCHVPTRRHKLENDDSNLHRRQDVKSHEMREKLKIKNVAKGTEKYQRKCLEHVQRLLTDTYV